MSDRAARGAAALGLALVVTACAGPEKAVLDNYFNAVRAKDNQTLSSFAAVNYNFGEPLESWKVVSAGEEVTADAPLPELAGKLRELEGQLATNKKEAISYYGQKPTEWQKVDDLKKRGGVVPAALSTVAAEYDKFKQKENDLKRQIAQAKADLEKEKRSARLSVGDMEGLESLKGKVVSKQVEVEVTTKGQAKAYSMGLRRYDLQRDAGGPRLMSRWIIQSVQPK